MIPNKVKTALIGGAAVLSLAFLGLALAGCAGGPRAAVPPGFSTYYVKADGSDSNDGLSEAAPFRSLRKAVDAANMGRIPTITVLGVLTPESEGGSLLDLDSVFVITNTRGTELTIRGKEGAAETEQGALSGAGAGKVVISIREESRVRFEFLRIEGGSSEYSGVGIDIRDRSQVILGEGVLVWNNHSQSSGGGVVVGDRGTFIMEGGKVSGRNTAQGGGGGVAVGDRGIFIMEGGEISGNESALSGGGVAVLANGTFTMRGGEISGNESLGDGGGVAVAGGIFTMEGGKISGRNTTQGGGGGVLVTGGTITLEEGYTSFKSIAQGSGGGGEMVSGTFIMRGGEISGNESLMGGGGVGMDRGTFTMEGGEISGNTSARRGGGVALDVTTGSTFNKTGGTIDATNSAGIGNAVYVTLGEPLFRKRDAAAGTDVNLDSGKPGGAGGWE